MYVCVYCICFNHACASFRASFTVYIYVWVFMFVFLSVCAFILIVLWTFFLTYFSVISFVFTFISAWSNQTKQKKLFYYEKSRSHACLCHLPAYIHTYIHAYELFLGRIFRLVIMMMMFLGPSATMHDSMLAISPISCTVAYTLFSVQFIYRFLFLIYAFISFFWAKIVICTRTF